MVIFPLAYFPFGKYHIVGTTGDRKMTLSEYLEKNKMTRNKIAIAARITAAMVNRFLSGERGLSPATAAKISNATEGQVSIEELLYPDGMPEDTERARMAAKDK